MIDKIYDTVNEIKTSQAEMKPKVDMMYKALYGNGQPGMFAICNQREGSIRTWKYIAGGGGLVGIISLAISIWG